MKRVVSAYTHIHIHACTHARTHTRMHAGTCTHKHTKLSIKWEAKLKIQVGLKMSKNEQIIFSSACSVWLFCQYLYEWKYFLFFFFASVWASQVMAMLVHSVPVWSRKGLSHCMFDIFTTQSVLVHDFTDIDCWAWKQRLVSCFNYFQTPVFLPTGSAVILKVMVIRWLEQSYTLGEPRRQCSRLYVQFFQV